MGFGHRVYKSYDPRAKLIKRVADDVFHETGLNPKLEIAMELERIALEDEYFIKRKLYPNVDFYSGLIYQAMGIPRVLTVLFALGRMPGWLAQWEEMLLDKDQEIARPRQIYTGQAGAAVRADREARMTTPTSSPPSSPSERRFPPPRTSRRARRPRQCTRPPRADGRVTGPSRRRRWTGSTLDRVLEWNPPHAKWFVGGKLNVSANCLDRHLTGPRRNKAAIIWEGSPAIARCSPTGSSRGR